ncbi:MAG: hypothetical protein KIH65_003410 [Candidatus Uhrbacteria bacterium]|nr:hypothetical protein [Candidatus Uhrbacteria bacterium]
MNMPKFFEHPTPHSEFPPEKSEASGIRSHTPPTGEETDVDLEPLAESAKRETSAMNARSNISRTWQEPQKPQFREGSGILEGTLMKTDAEHRTTSDQEIQTKIEEAKRDVSIAFEDLTFDTNPEEGLEVLKELIETHEHKAHVIKAIYPIAMEDMLRRYLNANSDLIEAYQKEPGATELIANIYIVLRNDIASEDIIDIEDDMAA